MRKKNFNYLATIVPKLVKSQSGELSKNQKRKMRRDSRPVEIRPNVFEFSDKKRYQRLKNGQMIEIFETDTPAK